MGNICCKPKKELDKKNDNIDSNRPLDRTQSIFVKSRVDEFKNHSKLADDDQEKVPLGLKTRFMNDSDSKDSDMEVRQLKSVESSNLEIFDNSGVSASRTSLMSRSIASHGNLDNIHLMT